MKQWTDIEVNERGRKLSPTPFMLYLCCYPPVEVCVVAEQVCGHLTDIMGCHIECD